MSVTNGQNASQTTFNNAFGSRLADTSYAGKQLFLNYTLRDVQNGIAAFAGGGQASATALTKNICFVTAVAADGDSVKLPAGETGMEIVIFNLAANDLTVFPQTGETINAQAANLSATVLAGDSERFVCRSDGAWHVEKGELAATIAQIAADLSGALDDIEDLVDQNTYFAEYQVLQVPVASAGADTDVSTEFAGRASGGGDSAAGVITDAPGNRVELRRTDSYEPVLSLSGLPVYGRITEAAGIWTLTYYILIGSTETPYSLLSSADILVLFREVFTKASRPTQPANIGPFLGSGGSGSSGGVGGSALIWGLPDSNSAAESFYGGLHLLDFDYLSEQEIWAVFQVPEGYVAGTQIFIRGLSFVTSATSGNVKFSALSYLVEDGVGALDPSNPSSTFHDSQNTPVAVSGTAYRPTAVGDIDLTSALGKIMSVDVASGDKIAVRLIRDSSGEGGSAAADARLIRHSGLIDFSG